MGLLDQFSSLSEEQNGGLLAAAAQILQQSGDPRRPFGLGQAMGAGISAYQGSTADAKRRKLEEEHLRMQAEMNGMKLQDARADFTNQEALRTRAAGLQSFYQGMGQRGQSPQGPDMGGMKGPTVENAAALEQQGQKSSAVADIYSQKIAIAQQLRQAGYHPEADAEEEKALKFRDEYSTDPQAMVGPDGKLGNYQISKYGTAPRNTGLGVKPEMVEMKLGNRNQWLDKNQVRDGQQYQIGVDPDTVYSGGITKRGQNMTDARARDFNSVQVEGNNIKRDEKRATLDLTKSSQVASFDTMLGTLDRLGKHPGLSRSVGITGAFPTMPGSESANFKAELETFQSQAFIPMVAQLKGMGALSDAEGKKLTAAVGALDPRMGETAFKDSIGRVVSDMTAARGRVAGEPTARPSASGDWDDAKPATVQPPLGAINMLKMNPRLQAEFDAKYGAGASARAMGK